MRTKAKKIQDIQILGLEKFMLEQEISDTWLSEQTGMTQPYINRLKHGYIRPRVDTALRVIEKLRRCKGLEDINIENTFLTYYRVPTVIFHRDDTRRAA